MRPSRLGLELDPLYRRPGSPKARTPTHPALAVFYTVDEEDPWEPDRLDQTLQADPGGDHLLPRVALTTSPAGSWMRARATAPLPAMAGESRLSPSAQLRVGETEMGSGTTKPRGCRTQVRKASLHLKSRFGQGVPGWEAGMGTGPFNRAWVASEGCSSPHVTHSTSVSTWEEPHSSPDQPGSPRALSSPAEQPRQEGLCGPGCCSLDLTRQSAGSSVQTG